MAGCREVRTCERVHTHTHINTGKGYSLRCESIMSCHTAQPPSPGSHSGLSGEMHSLTTWSSLCSQTLWALLQPCLRTPHAPPQPLFAVQLIPVPNTFISLPFGWCHDNEKLIKRQLGTGFWRFYASTRRSRGDPQQNRLIDWEAAGNGETYQVGWRIRLMDASADNANKNRLGGWGKKKFNNYICSLKDGGLKSAH